MYANDACLNAFEHDQASVMALRDNIHIPAPSSVDRSKFKYFGGDSKSRKAPEWNKCECS